MRKQISFYNATMGFSAKWLLRNNQRNSILMRCCHPGLGSALDLLKVCFNQSKALPRYGRWYIISMEIFLLLLANWTSFCRETNSGVAKCCLFSSGDNKCKILCQMLKQLRKMRLSHDCICNMVVIKVTYDFKPWSMDLLFSVRQKVFSRKRPLLKNLLLSSGNGGPCGSYCIWYDYFKLLLHNCTVLVTNFTVLNL